jgi:hypothetical protein
MIPPSLLIAALGGSSSVSPDQIANLFAWYNHTGIQSGDGVNIGDTSGHNWLDNTSNHYDLSWNGDGVAPVCRAGANGLNNLKIYDEGTGVGGVWKQTITGGPTYNWSTGGFFAVVKTSATGSGFSRVALTGDAWATSLHTGLYNFGTSSNGGGDSSTTPSSNAWHIYVADVNSGVVHVWVDNVLDTTISNISSGTGALTRIALGEATGTGVHGQIAEIAWWSASIGATNAAGLYHYAKSTYGL